MGTQQIEHVDDDPCTTVSVRHHLDSVYLVRRMMMIELGGHGYPTDLLADAELVMVELVANAVRHGEPNAVGEVDVSWCAHADHIRISVVDGGDVSGLQAKAPTLDLGGGRGLYLVDALCDNWSTDNQHGTRVTAQLSRPGAG